MIRFGGLLALVAFGFWLYALFDSITAPRERIRLLPKPVWVIVIVVLNIVGTVLWFPVGPSPRMTIPSSCATCATGPATTSRTADPTNRTDRRCSGPDPARRGRRRDPLGVDACPSGTGAYRQRGRHRYGRPHVGGGPATRRRAPRPRVAGHRRGRCALHAAQRERRAHHCGYGPGRRSRDRPVARPRRR